MTGTTSLHFIAVGNLSLLSSFKPTTSFNIFSDKSVEFFFFESDCNLTKALVDLNCACLLSFGCLILPVYLRCSSVFTRDCITYYVLQSDNEFKGTKFATFMAEFKKGISFK